MVKISVERKNSSLEFLNVVQCFVPYYHYGNIIISECAPCHCQQDRTEINFQHFTNELMSMRWNGFCWCCQIKGALIMEMISVHNSGFWVLEKAHSHPVPAYEQTWCSPTDVRQQFSSNNFHHNLFNHV